MQHRLPTLLTSLAIGITFAGAALVLIGSEAKARPMSLATLQNEPAYVSASPKLRDIYDRASQDSLPGVQKRELISNVRNLISCNEIRSAADYAVASAVLLKGHTAQDAMLAHDLAVCALALGNPDAKALVAVSQDLLLARLGQKQRFGTNEQEGRLVPVEKEVPDSMRVILGLPSLREAKKLAAIGKPFAPSVKHQVVLQPAASAVSSAVAVPQ